MRAEKVITNRTCNQNCTYCNGRSPLEDPGFVRRDAVLARIDEALRSGARELVLGGGEPAMRADLVELVRHARAGGAERVVLETNATLLDGERATALAAAGLDVARVNLSGAGPALDRTTRDEGGSERTLAGLQALARAGVTLELAVAVVESTSAGLSALPGLLARELPSGAVSAIVLAVPVESPEPAELLDYGRAALLVAAIDDAARAAGIPARLHPDSGPPPCVFPAQARSAHLFSLTPGGSRRHGFTRVPACAGCNVADRCPGFAAAYLARFPLPELQPITEERLRRRLSIVSSEAEQIREELVSSSRSRVPGSGELDERIIRVDFRCNQACRFCFVSTHLPSPGEASVRAAIRAAGEAGARIVLSGGEPALSPLLPELVRLAKRVSRQRVELQTNAVLLDDPALCARLVEAGLDDAFVSLHGSSAALSDEVTCSPGTFARTVVGIDNLAAAGVRVIVNFVICAANHRDLVPFVRLVAGRWKGVAVNLSFVAPSSDLVPRDAQLIPRYTEVLPYLAEACAEADRLGLRVLGFESMCGVPLCLVPRELEPFFELGALPAGSGDGEFTKPPPCSACALSDRCWGLRRGYAELHGDGELRPVPRRAAGSRPC